MLTLRKYIYRCLSAQKRYRIKRYIRKIKGFLSHKKKTTIEDLRTAITTGLGIHKGDKIFVTSSFGNLNAAGYTPKDVIDLLIDIVGPEGVVMMPYYPPMSSTEWAHSNMIFDMNNTKSGVGVLTNEFKKHPGTIMSVHPTKAVCVWGPRYALKLTKGHDNCTDPYCWESPYGKLIQLGSKSIGLGIKNFPIGHALQDIVEFNTFSYYEKKPYKLKVIDSEGKTRIVNTLIHDSTIINKSKAPSDFLRSLHCSTFKEINFGNAFLYVVDNSDALCSFENAAKEGFTCHKP